MVEIVGGWKSFSLISAVKSFTFIDFKEYSTPKSRLFHNAKIIPSKQNTLGLFSTVNENRICFQDEGKWQKSFCPGVGTAQHPGKATNLTFHQTEGD